MLDRLSKLLMAQEVIEGIDLEAYVTGTRPIPDPGGASRRTADAVRGDRASDHGLPARVGRSFAPPRPSSRSVGAPGDTQVEAVAEPVEEPVEVPLRQSVAFGLRRRRPHAVLVASDTGTSTTTARRPRSLTRNDSSMSATR